MTEGLRIYNLFPTLAGSIADWTAALPRIAAMGFNAVYVNPFHYPGFSGSLYAVKDYYRLNPRLSAADGARRATTTLLRGFTEAARGARAARHHGPRRQPHGQGQRVDRAPAAMVRPRRKRRDALALRGRSRRSRNRRPSGAIWPRLDYRPPQRDEIVAYFEELVRHYVGLGFRGFRCDAAYKVPAEVWRRLVDAAKSAIPDVVFCAENLGAREEEVLALAGAGFDYLFNSVKWWDFESPWLLDQYEQFRHIAPSIAFPGKPRHRAARHRTAGRRLPGGPDRGALPAGLCASAALLDRRHDADGLRIRLVAGASRSCRTVTRTSRSRRASTCSRLSPRSTA